MRIVQVIDSLEVGGAEKMAVNYANSLAKRISFSGLVATRREGNLKSQLDGKVHYLFLQRKSRVDLDAAVWLKNFCKENDVQWLQPHSSSYFLAIMVKFIYPKINIVWHDHNGLSEFLGSQKWIPLKFASFFFSGIIVVNYQLKKWAVKELFCKNVIYLPNFTEQQSISLKETTLNGTQGSRILCLANLRDQKNHFLLIRVAKKLKESHPEWTFHLVGKDFRDGYSQKLIQSIADENLQQHVYLYDSRNDTGHIIDQCSIAILTSKSEGLPVALLEYGLHSKPIVATNVGEIPMIIEGGINGYIVNSDNEITFHEALIKLIESEELRTSFGKALYKTVSENHSESAIIDQYFAWLNKIHKL